MTVLPFKSFFPVVPIGKLMTKLPLMLTNNFPRRFRFFPPLFYTTIARFARGGHRADAAANTFFHAANLLCATSTAREARVYIKKRGEAKHRG